MYRDSLRMGNRWSVPQITCALFTLYEHATKIESTQYFRYRPISEVKEIVRDRLYRLSSIIRAGLKFEDIRILWLRPSFDGNSEHGQLRE